MKYVLLVCTIFMFGCRSPKVLDSEELSRLYQVRLHELEPDTTSFELVNKSEWEYIAHRREFPPPLSPLYLGSDVNLVGTEVDLPNPHRTWLSDDLPKCLEGVNLTICQWKRAYNRYKAIATNEEICRALTTPDEFEVLEFRLNNR